MTTSLFDQIFRDDQGNIVIAQPPNLSLSIWIGASLLQLVTPPGTARNILEIIALVAITVWALQELLDGVNYFRKGLGLIVLISLCLSRIDLLLS